MLRVPRRHSVGAHSSAVVWIVVLLGACGGRGREAGSGSPNDSVAKSATQGDSTPKRDAPVRAPWGGLQVAERGDGQRAVLLLHGYGSRGDDLVDFATRLEDHVPALYLIPGGPLTNSTGEGRAWFEPALSSQQNAADRAEAAHDVGASRARLDGVLETLYGRGVARDAVVVAGFSQGGMVACDLALCGEHAVRAVAVFSGAHISPCPTPRSIEGMRWFVSHGQHDDIIPPGDVDAAVEELERRGALVEYVRFDGGHEITPEVRNRFIAWLGQTFEEEEERIPSN